MSIVKWYEIICDNCGQVLGRYSCSKKLANLFVQREGYLKRGDRHFCDDYCYRAWKERNGRFAE